MNKLLLFISLFGQLAMAQDECQPFIEVEHTDFFGNRKETNGIYIYLKKADGSKVSVNFGKASISVFGVGLEFKGRNRAFYFPFSVDSLKDVCFNYNIKYVYQTEDSSGIIQRTFLSLEYVDKDQSFLLCNEKITKGIKEDLLKKRVLETIQKGASHYLVYKQIIVDVREHFREQKMYELINLNDISNFFEDEFTIEIPNILSFPSASWGTTQFAYLFIPDPRKNESNPSGIHIYNDWNRLQSPLRCYPCTTMDSTYQNGKKMYYGVSDAGLYWKYFYYKNFGLWYVNVKKEDLTLFEHAFASFKVGAEIDKIQLNAKKRH